MTHLMFEINLLLGCEAARWFTCCFEGREFEVLGLQMLFFFFFFAEKEDLNMLEFPSR